MTEIDDIGNLFRLLADIDFKGASPLYETLSRGAADDPDVLSLLLPAGATDRLPHLLFAAVKYLHGDPLGAFDAYPAFRAWCLGHRAEIEAVVATHAVQTNEVGRCAALMPTLGVVSRLAGRPLAVLEVGASAGLNLLFDRYGYDYGAGPGAAEVVLRPRLEGDHRPGADIPEVVWRRGLDRYPVDVTDDDAVRWLWACIWPEQTERMALLDRAVAVARRDPPTVVKGDAFEALPALIADAPDDAALCVVHTAVLPYVPDYPRFGELLAGLAGRRPIWWVSGEGQGIVAALQAPAREGLSFLYGYVPLGVDGHEPCVAARAHPHGTWLEWLLPS